MYPPLQFVRDDGFTALNLPWALPVHSSDLSNTSHIVGILRYPATFLTSTIFPPLFISIAMTEFTMFLFELKHFLEQMCIESSFFTTISCGHLTTGWNMVDGFLSWLKGPGLILQTLVLAHNKIFVPPRKIRQSPL